MSEGGEKPKQGTRTDLVEAHRELLNAESWGELVVRPDMVAYMARYGPWCKLVYEHRNKKGGPTWQPKDWQADAVRRVGDFCRRCDDDGKPMARNIFWVWSHQGNTGKSVFQQILQQHFGTDYTKMIPTGQERMADMYDGQKVVGIDIPRAEYMVLDRAPEGGVVGVVDLKKIQRLCTFLETLNDFGATIVSARYQGTRKVVLCRCVVVTSNMSPEEAGLKEAISMDRIHSLDVGTWAPRHLPMRYGADGGGTAPNGGGTPPLPTGGYQQFSASPIAEDVENGAGGSA